MGQIFEGAANGAGLRIAIVNTRWNEFITDKLLSGAQDALRRHGVDDSQVDVAIAPGAFEIPLTVQTLAQSGRYDAIIALGCVIRGATPHFDYVASESAKGLTATALKSNVPVAFGILTVRHD